MRNRIAILVVAGLGLATACTPPRVSGGPLPAEGPASSDVYLYRMGGLPFMGRGRVDNLSQRPGYDNQPFWDGNSRLLYTSQHGGQTDIYAVDFRSNRIERITETPESEYSPAPTPDNRAIAVVRVERDSTQRLWAFPRDGGAPRVILPDIRPVGYFAWLDSSTVALFILGSPNSLQIADTRTGTARVAAHDIGRSLQRVPGGRRASFLHRGAGGSWVLRTVDSAPRPDGSLAIDSLAVMPDSAEYVVWRSAQELYTAAGSRILRLRLPGGQWEQVADLAGAGVRGITRLALSPDGRRMALVAQEPQTDVVR